MTDPHISEVDLDALLLTIAEPGEKLDRLYAAKEAKATLTALLAHHTQSVLDVLEARLPKQKSLTPTLVLTKLQNMGFNDCRNQVRETIKAVRKGDK